jgi:hypothetical protein
MNLVPMTTRRWILQTLLYTVVIGGAFVRLNMALDVYGLFADVHGRSLPIYGSERRAKYLLNQHYVPETFAAVLIGSSVTGNWDTTGISSLRTYNESTDGGNITEEKVLVDRALERSGLKAAVCVLHPFLTDTHGLNTEEMSDREYWGALGSISLVRAYETMLKIRLGREKLVWNAFGSEHTESRLELNPTLKRIMVPDVDFHVDEVGFDEYRALIVRMRGQGLRLAAVVPPTLAELLEPKREAMDRYVERMRTLFTPEDAFIDFNAPRYEAFRRERSNFRDGVHLSFTGAAEVVRLLDERLRESLGWAG